MVVIGFGEFKNYKIQEVPDEFLTQLANAYSLSHEAHGDSGKSALLATIAVHEELRRRASGGEIWKRPVARKELAVRLVRAGFRHLSKQHHPDTAGGDLETQKLLAEMRDYLLDACANLREPDYPQAFAIPDPDPYSAEITDDDIPF